jgi:5-methylcytosine-specific restriction endonuclease McrA
VDTLEKLRLHPIKTGKGLSREEWISFRLLKNPNKLKMGDYNPETGLYFLSYHPQCKNALRWTTKERLNATSKFRALGLPNPNRKKTEEERVKNNRERDRRNKPAKRARHKARMLTDPEYAAKTRQRWREANEKFKAQRAIYFKNRGQTPLGIAERRIRNSLRRHLDKLLFNGEKTTMEGARFLCWLAKKRGLQNLKKDWHVDHIIPLSKFDLTKVTRKNVNAPENLRWLTPAENWAKSDAMPTQQEIDEHLKLVAQWRAECEISS